MRRISIIVCACLVLSVSSLFTGCGGSSGGGGGGIPDLGNLMIGTLSFTVTNTAPNGVATVTISRTITNDGTEDATADIEVKYYFSTDTTLDTGTDTLAGTETVTADVLEGSFITGTFDLDSGAVLGTFYLFAVVDTANAHIELNEFDNESAVSSNTVLVGLPDLEVDQVSFGTTAVNVGELASINRRLRNTGDLDAGVYDVEYTLSTDTILGNGDDIVIPVVENAAVLAQGVDSSGQYAFDTTAIAQAIYYCFAVTDDGGVITESDESDNTSAVSSNTLQITTGLLPNLEGTIASSITSVYEGQLVVIDVTSSNTGGAAAGGSFGQLWFDNTADLSGAPVALTGAATAVAALDPGETAAQTITATVVIPNGTGPFFLVWEVDTGGGAVAESDEGDNLFASAVTVTGPPDIVAGASTVPANTSPLDGLPVRAGDTVVLTSAFTEANGVDVPDDIDFQVYLSPDDLLDIPGDTPLDADTFTGGLSVSDSFDITVTIPADSPRGSGWLGVDIDNADNIPETNDANNNTTSGDTEEIVILMQKLSDGELDLMGDEPYPRLDYQGQIYINEEFMVEIEVGSLGDAPGGAVQVDIGISDDAVWDGDGNNGDYIDVTATTMVTLDSMWPFTEEIVTCTAPGTAGTYYLFQLIDDPDTYSEEDETNNVSRESQQIEVIDSGTSYTDLRASDGGGGPEPFMIVVDEDFAITTMIRNDSNREITTAFDVVVYASNDAIKDPGVSDQPVHTFAYTGLPAGYKVNDDGPASTYDVINISAAEATACGLTNAVWLYYVIDDGDTIAEDDEFNNTRDIVEDAQFSPVPNSGLAELAIIMFFEGEPGPVAPQPPTFYVTAGATNVTLPMVMLLNIGSEGVAAGTEVNFYLATTPALTADYDVSLTAGAYTAPALPSGALEFQAGAASIDVSAVPVGTYYLYAVIDPNDNVPEMDMLVNDSATLSFPDVPPILLGSYIPVVIYNVPTKPELQGRIVTDERGGWGFNDTIEIECRIDNTAMDEEADNSLAGLYVSADALTSISAGDDFIDYAEVTYLQPAMTGWTNFGIFPPFSQFTAGGTYYLKLVVDLLDEIDEKDETNNVSVQPFVCVVKEPFTGSMGTFTVANNGTGAAAPWAEAGDVATVSGHATDTTDTTMTSPAYNLAAYQKVFLTFSYDWNPIGGEMLDIEINTGFGWESLSGGSVQTGTGLDGAIDLSEKASEEASVRLRFTFTAPGGSTGTVAIDEFMIIGMQ